MDRRQFLRVSALGAAGAMSLSRAENAVAAPTVLTAADFQYKGLFLLPYDPGGTIFAYSNGALAGRYVNGQLRLIITGKWDGNTWLDPVYEVNYPGVGQTVSSAPRATLVQAWGDIYQNKRLYDPSELAPVTRGLLWANGMLWWAYGGQYNVAGNWDPSIGVTVFNDSNGTFASYGPWRTQDYSQVTRGYLTAIPSTFANQYTHGNTIAVGAPATSGNATSSIGSCLTALSSFNPLTTPSDAVGSTHWTLGCQDLLMHSQQNPQMRPAGVSAYKVCGWNVLYNCAQGAYTQIDPTMANAGIGFDTISAAAWVQTSTRQGLVMFGQLVDAIAGYNYGTDTVPHMWYGPENTPCCHGQVSSVGSGTGPKASTMQAWMWIYDPANLAQSAQGLIKPYAVTESTAVRLHPMAPGITYPVSQNYMFGGAFFDSVSGLLFVTDVNADNFTNSFDWRPAIHVFSVAGGGAAPPAAPTNLRIVSA
jgi:hypothetical protein